MDREAWFPFSFELLHILCFSLPPSWRIDFDELTLVIFQKQRKCLAQVDRDTFPSGKEEILWEKGVGSRAPSPVIPCTQVAAGLTLVTLPLLCGMAVGRGCPVDPLLQAFLLFGPCFLPLSSLQWALFDHIWLEVKAVALSNGCFQTISLEQLKIEQVFVLGAV